MTSPVPWDWEEVFLLPDGSAFLPRQVTPKGSWWEWLRLLDVLSSGRRVPLCQEAALFLACSRRVQCMTRAGFVIDVGGRMVRLWTKDGCWWGEALPPPLSSPCVGHALSCATGSDGWEVLVCVNCGGAW